jgi:hypothetical protein
MFILPSRGRPHNMQRLIDACIDHDTTAPIHYYLDDDDPTLDGYRALKYPETWFEHVGPRKIEPESAVWHACEQHFKEFPEEPYYGVINDDIIPRTDRWDAELIKTAGDDFIAYGDDLLQGARMCTFPVVGGGLVRKVGWFCYPGLNIDTGWHIVGSYFGWLRYRPDVILEHMHYLAKKAPFDETYDVPAQWWGWKPGAPEAAIRDVQGKL